MKIAQVTPVYPPYRGGIGSIAEGYTDRLRALGHTVEVFSPWLRIGNAGFLSLSQLRRLKEFDLVHLHYPFFGGAELIAVCGGLPPCIITYHMDAMAGGVKGKIFELHRKFLQPLILAKASKVLVSSLDYAKHSGLAPFFAKYPERVTELPFGVDVPSATSVPTVPSQLLFVGGLDTAHAFKGVSVLLQAMRELPEARLQIVGDGNLRQSYEAQARELGIENRIEFLGSLSPQALQQTYRNAAIHVLPSTSRAEAFGLVTLEAASHGIPSIVSDLPGVRTLVQDGVTGFRTSLGDVPALAQAISHLLQDQPLREKMGQAAREWVVKEYDWEVLMKHLMEVYESAL